ncbi:hypothetical protein QTQ03_29485 [Micromonospora sp. WMMA1363]|uniref:hypothetical protein n=1 Tax=Micromonospora sp. WMMA1363 TaxID=3053985 RepID=UPI00259CDB86|nr:hypothetical protein [Micromonospora sp. WMMA1363]MDM4723512.1 hypothetical protein [Micromonospora sp. WMMA1363]
MRALVPRRLRARLSPLRRRVVRLLRRVKLRMATRASSARQYQFVFIVTYARSGSTLLAGILNSLPGYRICGENYNALYRLYQADTAIAKACDRYSGDGYLVPQNAWYGVPRIRPHRFRAELVDNFVSNEVISATLR